MQLAAGFRHPSSRFQFSRQLNQPLRGWLVRDDLKRGKQFPIER
ncbi:hypothetical protein [Mesorhizobium sp. B3-1-6]|nr:hypothetical protein [Mesorhizobium sp. B3-1-6]